MVEFTTYLTTMNQRPLAIFFDPDTDRFHHSAAISSTIALFIIYMKTKETIRTVVSVTAAGTGGFNLMATILATKIIRTVVYGSEILFFHSLPSFIRLRIEVLFGRYI